MTRMETEVLEKNMSIKMSPSMVSDIEDLAREDQRTFSQMARMLIEKGLKLYIEENS